MSLALLKSKRAQMKMFETIGVLIVFMIIFSIGISFYGRVQEQSFLDAQAKFSEFDSIKMSVVAMHLPELSCTLRDVVGSSCIDLDKARFFEAHSSDIRAHYVTLFGQGRIWIEQFYPSEMTFELYNLTPSSDYALLLTPHPIVIYNSTTRSYGLGTLYVEKYVAVVQ